MEKIVIIILLAGGFLFNGMNVPDDNSARYVTDEEFKCTDCHSDLVEKKTVHAPASEDCKTCHEPLGENHPDDGKGFKLTASLGELCGMCHDGISGGAVVHDPVSKAKCTSCHSPHSSDNASLLLKEPKELCLSCHKKTYKSETGITRNIKKQLDNNSHIHGILDADGCLPCHKPHASDNAHLLGGAYPAGNYDNGSKENFALCFECHESGILTEQKSTTITSFRNGDKNLHYVHLNGPKARSCSNCHNVHAAPNAHLIENNVEFKTWDMPLNYEISETGGSCRTGCHGTKTYVR